MRVLVACEFSGRVRDEFIKLGHEAISCDILPTEIDNPHYQGDVFDIVNDGWDLMIAHPPCTHLAVSGARWFKEKRKDGRQQKAIEFFLQLTNVAIEKICIENPVSIMSTFYRKPNQIIQPYQFGHIEAKKTCLWLKNLPVLRYGQAIQQSFEDDATPSFTEIKEPIYTTFASGKRMATWYIEAAKDKENRGVIRSRTFKGIAKAMAEQWSSLGALIE